MLIDVSEFLWKHGAKVTDDNRLTMRCLCDGTAIFLVEMIQVLKKLGCTDIQTDGRMVTEGIPEDKPWCNCLYEASGVLPDTICYIEETNTLLIDNPPGQEQTEDWERYKKDLLESVVPSVGPDGWPGYILPVVYTDEGTQYIDTGYRPEKEG